MQVHCLLLTSAAVAAAAALTALLPLSIDTAYMQLGGITCKHHNDVV